MIRINLLSEGRRPVVARRAKATLGDQDPALFWLLGGFLIGALIAGGMWWVERTKAQEIDASIARAQREVNDLAEIIKKVEDFKLKKAALENKIAVIQDLKRKQKGPVQVMDNVSGALPDLLWLDSLRMTGNTVNLRGQALNTAAVAGFIGNLHDVEQFKEPDTKDIRASGKRLESYTFNLVFSFVHDLDAKNDGEDSSEFGL